MPDIEINIIDANTDKTVSEITSDETGNYFITLKGNIPDLSADIFLK